MEKIRWNWILNGRSDLTWFIGSALAGWTYVCLVLLIGGGLADPFNDFFYIATLGNISIPLNLELLIFASWAYWIDAPHIWATLVRTYLDPDEWIKRRRQLVLSMSWFLVGPLAILGPYLLGAVLPLGLLTATLGRGIFFGFLRLWSYFHIVRQHWGVLMIYKHKNGDILDVTENRADFWFFNLSLYLPLLFFISLPWQPRSGFLDVELDIGFIHAAGIIGTIYPIVLALYAATIVGYIGFQLARWFRGVPRNGPKILLLLAVVPLHFVVLSHPLLALFAMPIVTVGHNLQYHRIVWLYGRNKYVSDSTGRYGVTRHIFRWSWFYFLTGLIFTFGLCKGPWIDFIGDKLGLVLDKWIFQGIAMMAGTVDPGKGEVGAEIMSALFAGWFLQHFYLDGKIWRLSRDPGIAKVLKL